MHPTHSAEVEHARLCRAEFVVVDTGGLMSDASQLPVEERSAAQRLISDVGLPQARPALWSGPYSSTHDACGVGDLMH